MKRNGLSKESTCEDPAGVNLTLIECRPLSKFKNIEPEEPTRYQQTNVPVTSISLHTITAVPQFGILTWHIAPPI